jgi:hypothetical protein
MNLQRSLGLRSMLSECSGAVLVFVLMERLSMSEACCSQNLNHDLSESLCLHFKGGIQTSSQGSNSFLLYQIICISLLRWSSWLNMYWDAFKGRVRKCKGGESQSDYKAVSDKHG